MEKAECFENTALNGWAAIYERELKADEIMEIESNIQKMAELLIEINGSNTNG
jgi:hypothetical protein